MKSIRPLLAAATVAGMLAAGCDYWRNLVDDKVVTQAPLHIKVMDAFTEETMADVRCQDPSRGLDTITDPSGEIFLPYAGTGLYSVTCSNPLYYDRTSTFALTASGVSAVIGLARHGGKDEWYKGDTTREVRILNKFDTIRFPSTFQMNSLPLDIHSRFRYQWTFDKATNLNRDTLYRLAGSQIYTMNSRRDDAKSGPGDPVAGPDVLTLVVYTTMNGKDKPYEVGTYKRPFIWVKNQLPTFTMLLPVPQVPVWVGCPDNQPLRVQFKATDPDGGCVQVAFSTKQDSNTAFGVVDRKFPCNHHDVIQFPLKNTFDSLRHDSSLYLENKLYVSVEDDNFEYYQDSIQITTRTNILPTLTAKIEGNPAVVFTGDEVKVTFEGFAVNQEMLQTITLWGDGDDAVAQTIRKYGLGTTTVHETVSHYYDEPSTLADGFKIGVTALDKCDALVYASAGSVKVRKNTEPKLTVVSTRQDMSSGNLKQYLQLSITDPDVKAGLDRYTRIIIAWGDSSVVEDSTRDGEPYKDREVVHQYGSPPGPRGYPVSISVHDAHRGTSAPFDTLISPP